MGTALLTSLRCSDVPVRRSCTRPAFHWKNALLLLVANAMESLFDKINEKCVYFFHFLSKCKISCHNTIFVELTLLERLIYLRTIKQNDYCFIYFNAIFSISHFLLIHNLK